MSWTYTDKIKVSALSGISQGDLMDFYSDWVEELIDDWVGTSYKGTQTYTNEMHNGDGTSTLFVDHPPIVSVSGLSVFGGSYTSSDYKVFSHYIELVTSVQTEMSGALYAPAVFPVGPGNVLITYVGQSAVVPKKVEFAATQMIAAIAMVSMREGADASLKYSRVTRSDGETSTTTEQFGLQGTLVDIMKRYLPRKVMAE